MERSLLNKIVVVTGGAEGIGFEIVKHFLAHKVKTVIILDCNEAKGINTINDLNSENGDNRVVFMKCDVTKDLEEVSKKIFDTYKQVDVLVNNAGICDEQSPRKTIEVNLLAVIEWSMRFWEHMRKDKGGNGGTILNMGSIYSYTMDPYLVYYKATKFGVQGFTRSLGHVDNYKKFGVRLIVICPGYTYSKLTESKLCWEEQVEDLDEFLKTAIWQKCEEVGKAAVTVFENGDTGTAWKIIGGELGQVNFLDN